MPVPDPQRFEDGLRNQLLGAIRQVIGVKMASGQLQFRNLGEGTLGDTPGEIIAASGLAQQGVQIGNLAMQFAIDNGPPQREVRANINVGGFHIHASSTGGINAGSLANQAIEKAKSAILWYVMGAVLVAVISGVAWWYVKRTVRTAIDQSVAVSTGANLPAWDGKSPFMCGGTEHQDRRRDREASGDRDHRGRKLHAHGDQLEHRGRDRDRGRRQRDDHRPGWKPHRHRLRRACDGQREGRDQRRGQSDRQGASARRSRDQRYRERDDEAIRHELREACAKSSWSRGQLG